MSYTQMRFFRPSITAALILFSIIRCSDETEVERRLKATTIPTIEMDNVSLLEFAKWIETTFRKSDPSGRGVKIKLVTDPEMGFTDEYFASKRVTIHAEDLPMWNAIEYGLKMCFLRFKIEGREILVIVDVAARRDGATWSPRPTTRVH